MKSTTKKEKKNSWGGPKPFHLLYIAVKNKKMIEKLRKGKVKEIL